MCLSVCMLMCLSVNMSVCMLMCLSVFPQNWVIPSSSPHTSRRRPSMHNSCASLSSAHSVSSLGSQDSINITAPMAPGTHPPGTHPQATAQHNNNVPAPPPAPGSQPIPSTVPTPPVAPVPPSVTPTPPPAAPPPPAPGQGAQYAAPQGMQYGQPQGATPTNNAYYSEGQQSYGAQYAVAQQQAPPPPTQYAPPTTQYAPSTSQYAPSTSQYAPPTSQYAPPTSQYAPSTSQYAPPTSQYAPPTSQYAQYPAMTSQGGTHQGTQLPPPPPPNFPPTPDTCYDTAGYRPHPPAANVAYDENFEPISVASSMSVSPSQVSLSSHQSSESGRSLSPPVGPTRSPNQNRAQLSSLQEEVAPPTDLQAALLNKLKHRKNSFDNDPYNSQHLPALPRTTSVGSRAPPVAYKPPRGPNKPSRSSSLRIASTSGNLLVQL